MKKTLSLLFAMAAVPAALAAEKKPLPAELPPFGEDKPLPVPRIAESKLPNGLTVWLVARPGFPRAVAVLAVRGGSADDPKGAEGIAELLADTVREGTKARTSRAIAEELQAVGAELGSFAGADAIYLSVNGLGAGTARMVEILSDVARNASFPPAEVELAKANAMQGRPPGSPRPSSWPRRRSRAPSTAITPIAWSRRRARRCRRPLRPSSRRSMPGASAPTARCS
jgi:hypothetical protein